MLGRRPRERVRPAIARLDPAPNSDTEDAAPPGTGPLRQMNAAMPPSPRTGWTEARRPGRPWSSTSVVGLSSRSTGEEVAALPSRLA
ncbi:hypothetical protein ACIBPB_01045 [Micromonospora sp. NPDC049836]|uniref:hypothetical protein n=1 Tax=Micromonospora sp. NPDC049836 TaxID=3364274 RepID=UPI00378F1E2B